MKMLNKNVFTGLQQVARFSDRETPVKVSYAVGKSLVPLRVQFELIEKERTKVVKKYRQLDKDGKVVLKENGDPDLTDEDAAAEELETLGNEECEIELHTISKDDFMELMERKECSECGESLAVVSSNEMAALIKLGILT